MDIQGLSAIVTGGASGLGEATARRLAAAGAKVTIFDLNKEAGEKVAKSIGGRFETVNVTSEEDVTGAIDRSAKAHGEARILVNCAGIAIGEKTVGRENIPHNFESFKKTIEINLIGTFNVIRLATAEWPLSILWRPQNAGSLSIPPQSPPWKAKSDRLLIPRQRGGLPP